ncbi:MAG: phosphopantothenoylcysteine decarboxylase, partial [Planctomycetota bacterium]
MNVLILSGPTREYLDPVRYLSNASSGRQGAELARAALERGHRVTVVQGPTSVDLPAGVQRVDVISAEDMLEAASNLHTDSDLVIGAAAVSDFRPANPSDRKRKRSRADDERWSLELVPNPDVLKSLGYFKQSRIHVGFALETESLIDNARRKLEEKNLDWIVANSPDAIDAG